MEDICCNNFCDCLIHVNGNCKNPRHAANTNGTDFDLPTFLTNLLLLIAVSTSTMKMLQMCPCSHARQYRQGLHCQMIKVLLYWHFSVWVFWGQVIPVWVFLRPCNFYVKNGYGQLWVNGKTEFSIYTHRFFFCLVFLHLKIQHNLSCDVCL